MKHVEKQSNKHRCQILPDFFNYPYKSLVFSQYSFFLKG